MMMLKDAGIRISMDGCGRWMDNVFIERLWRSLKYECVFLNAFETDSEARSGIGSWVNYYGDARTQPSAAGNPTRSMLRRKRRSSWRPKTNPIHLSQAAKLSRQAGPPLHVRTRRVEPTSSIVAETSSRLKRANFPSKSKAENSDSLAVGISPHSESFCARKSTCYDGSKTIEWE
jgi:putative transposase